MSARKISNTTDILPDEHSSLEVMSLRLSDTSKEKPRCVFVNKICKYYCPGGFDQYCKGESMKRCGNCGIYSCGKNGHQFHICRKDPRCYRCNRPSDVMEACHNSEINKGGRCSAIYCKKCMEEHHDEIVLKWERTSPNSHLPNVFIIAKCFKCRKDFDREAALNTSPFLI